MKEFKGIEKNKSTKENPIKVRDSNPVKQDMKSN